MSRAELKSAVSDSATDIVGMCDDISRAAQACVSDCASFNDRLAVERISIAMERAQRLLAELGTLKQKLA